jgi:hypothetical protein
MKNLVLTLSILFTSSSFSQNFIEVSIFKLSHFAMYGQDSLHLMIKNTALPPVNEIYESCNKKLIIDKKARKVYQFLDNSPYDTLIIKKISVKDSIYTLIFNECIFDSEEDLYDTYADTYLILDTRKKSKNKKVPLLCYHWYWPINDYSQGYVSDYINLEIRNTFQPKNN